MLLVILLASSRVSPLGDLCIAHIGVAVDIGERLTIRVHDLEAAVQRFDGPWWRESSQLQGNFSLSA